MVGLEKHKHCCSRGGAILEDCLFKAMKPKQETILANSGFLSIHALVALIHSTDQIPIECVLLARFQGSGVVLLLSYNLGKMHTVLGN